MAKQTARDSQGNVFEWSGSEWVPQLDDPGAVGAAMIGAGATFTNIGRGVADLAAGAVEAAAPGQVTPFREQLARDVASDAPIMQQLEEQRPISTTAGRVLPYVAAAPLGGSSYAGQVAFESVLGGLEYGTAGERAQRALLAGGLTAGGGAILNSVVGGIQRSAANVAQRQASFGPSSVGAGARGGPIGQGSTSQARGVLQNAGRQVPGQGAESPADLEAMLTLRQEGFNLKPSATSGNLAGRQLYQSLESNPLFSDITQGLISNPNQNKFNQSVFDALGGLDAEDLSKGGIPEFTPSTVGKIRARVGEQREAIQAATPETVITGETIDQIRKVSRNFQKSVGVLSKEDPVIRRISNTLGRISDGEGASRIPQNISTKDMITIRSDLRGLADTAKLPAESRAYADVVQALDDAFEATLVSQGNREGMQQFMATNQQFRLLDALDKPGVISAEGDVKAAALNRNLKKIFKDEYGANQYGGLRTSGETGANMERLFNISKALGRFPDVAGRSGTAENLSLQGLFESPISTASQASFRPVVRRLLEGAQVSPEVLQDQLEVMRSLANQ